MTKTQTLKNKQINNVQNRKKIRQTNYAFCIFRDMDTFSIAITAVYSTALAISITTNVILFCKAIK